MKMNNKTILTSVALFVYGFASLAHAQEATDNSDEQASDPLVTVDSASESAEKQANNPLAAMTAFNFQDYYTSELSGSDETSNAFWMRYAKPFKLFGGDWLLRASLPVMRAPTGPDTSTSGIGDSNAFSAYLFDTGNPAVSVGVGPIVGLPTATGDVPTNDQWSAGLAAVLFNASSDVVQWGGLLTWQHGFGSSDSGIDTNVTALQPFVMIQMGKGLYLRSTGIWTYNLETNDYVIPIGLGIGKVIPSKNMVFNVFIEPQITILSRGNNQPEIQWFLGFNVQIPN